jgi:hypothetical protein
VNEPEPDPEPEPQPESEPVPEPQPDRPTIAPFLGALAIIVLVVIGIVAFNAFGDDRPRPEDVGVAVVGQNDALQRMNYADYLKYTCRSHQGKEADVIAQQRDSVAKNGQRYVDDVTAIRIDGDRASAVVTYHFDRTVDTTSGGDLNFVREDGAWKVC